ncbi:MAG: gamma-glutamyltransferase [Chlorobi bacterium]|nr:gamma-glutamyltransferase [Chlorobiota bacterium]MCI0714874.1 gamma-glutamyltransferase [Chlorobiota bacterium]
MVRKNLGFLITILLLFLFLYYASYFNKPLNGTSLKPPSAIQFKSNVSGKNGMVVSASKYASQVGIDILQRGGNAVDAAVAIGFALAVTYPQAGNIGGGGFMVIKTKDTITSIDYREKAPLASVRNMYLDSLGNFLPEKSQIGHLSAGVPGSVAGLLYALEKYGTMSQDEILDPAIKLAEGGFEIQERFAESLNDNYETFNEYPSTRKIFTKGGLKFNQGELFIQKDLANTLKLIKIHGRDGFYSGITAELIEKEMQSGGGIITKEDLLNYQAVERKVIHSNYKGYEIYSMAPPSSGGIALIQLLNMVENESIPNRHSVYYGVNDYANYLQVVFESMKRVYADRSEYLGDPDFWDVPVNDLISKQYSLERRKQIRDNSTPAGEIKPGLGEFYKESSQTTHYSVIDKDGNMVSVTTTLNNTYGSFVVVDGAGFLLNDEMDDFASKPGEPNMFGLIGSDANAIAPNKRMLSSMTPTIILKDGSPFMILGSPGGGKIITSVFQTIVNIIDFKMSLDSAIDKPRYHHQWLPEYVQYEAGAIDNEVMAKLVEKGHELKEVPDFGRVEGILIDWTSHTYYGHSDRRGYGKAIGY